MKRLAMLLAVLFAVAYPFIVYFGLGTLGPRLLAGFLMAFTLIRYWASSERGLYLHLLTALVVGLCLLIMVQESAALLKIYPVLFSLGFAAAFYFSLSDEYNLIERMAMRFGSEMHDEARFYIRRLVLWWVGVLILNALISAYTALYGTLYQWTLYNGLLSYLLLGGFMLGEMCFRYYYKKSRGIPS